MEIPSQVEEQARKKRSAAARVRRLARDVFEAEDRARLEQFARELDSYASELETKDYTHRRAGCHDCIQGPDDDRGGETDL